MATGSIDSIKKALQPGISFKLEVLGGGEPARGALEGLPNVGAVVVEGDLLRFQFNAPRQEVAELVRSLVAKGIAITGLQEEKTDLESLFMRLTKGEVS